MTVDLKKGPYALIRALMSEFLSAKLALPIDAAHIICPSKRGDFATAVVLAFKLEPQASLLAVKGRSPWIYGAPLFDNVWLENGYLNFTVSERFLINAARQTAKTLQTPVVMTDLDDALDYAIARAWMLKEFFKPCGDLKQPVPQACKDALFLAFGCFEPLTDERRRAILNMALKAILPITFNTPEPYDFSWQEYADWMLRFLWRLECEAV